ncbi:MAG: hypothetical protein FWC86_00845 [Coriobacteriia bacterium]|nr:hypothetical protein [Coriobacteriia bacterium]
MIIEAINESIILYRPAAQGDDVCTAQDILQAALSAKDAKGILSFVTKVPYSFLRTFRETNFCVDSHDLSSQVPFDELLHFDWQQTDELLQNLTHCLARHFSEIEYLDYFLANSGDLGKVASVPIDDPVHRTPENLKFSKEVDMSGKGYAVISTFSIVELIKQVKSLLTNIAIANRGATGEMFAPVAKDGVMIAQLASYGFCANDREYELPIQNPSIDELFDKKTIAQLESQLEADGYELQNSGSLKDTDREELGESKYFVDKGGVEVPLYPSICEAGTIAANLATSVMNCKTIESLFPVSLTREASLRHEKSCFTLYANSNPMQELFEAIAKCAIDDLVKLCVHCQHPMIGQGKHCSNSCKTNANNARRDKAYSMAASGKLASEAIEVIGAEYAKAIERWYKEANELIADTSTK